MRASRLSELAIKNYIIALLPPMKNSIGLCTAFGLYNSEASACLSVAAKLKQFNKQLHANEVTAPPFTASSGLAVYAWCFT